MVNILGVPMASLIGYARVSSTDQSTAVQVARLKEAGCQVIRREKGSGRTRDGRTELAIILDFIRPGDTLAVVKLDRLGRSTRDVLNLVHELESKDAHLRVLEPEVSTKRPSPRWCRQCSGWSPRWRSGSSASASALVLKPPRPGEFTKAGQ